jgi:hypothetical protein
MFLPLLKTKEMISLSNKDFKKNYLIREKKRSNNSGDTFYQFYD